MPRFLSRAGTHIDDLERQLARVGSAGNDDGSDNQDEEEEYSDSHSTSQAVETSTLLSPKRSIDEPASYNSISSVSVRPRRRRFRRRVSADAPRKLGTWDGVFMPVMLSIWGILVFVRMGYFISQVGIAGTVGAFVGGYTITTMTTLSISAISTNGTVKGGGPYYMLSRSLGPEFGGSIGLMFYAGTLLAGVLNDVAFVEPLLNNFGQNIGDVAQVFPEGRWWCILYNSILLIFCTIVCLTGAQMFAKASTALSTLIIAATVSMFVSFCVQTPFEHEEKHIRYTSWSMATFKENLWPDLAPIAEGKPAETLGTVFGVLFPACVGIMAGASMSSNLRKPGKSIPKGTLWAVIITFFLYIGVVVMLGATTHRSTLRQNFNVLQEINVVPLLIPIGAITTSVTSTLSGLLSSASIMQAIAKDDLFAFLRPFKRVDRSDNPVNAIILTYVISQLALLAGDINAVAPYTTMFNLIMFGFVNLACLVLKLAASVNFRPTFHYFKAWTAFLGASGCFAVMIFVDAISALVSTGVVILLFLYVHFTCPPKPWGDVTQSLIYHQCRKFMLRLDVRKDHVKFWRPQILLLVHNPRSSFHLIRFCNALKKGGLYVIGHVIKGDFYESLPEMRQQEAAWMRLIDFAQVKAFLNLAVDTDEGAGARSIIFGAGLGGMRPNIVVMGFLKLNQQWPSNRQSDTGAIDDVLLPTDGIKLNTPIEPQAYLRIIEDVLLMGKAIGIAYGFSKLGLTMPDAHSLVSPQSWWFGPRKHAHTSPHKTRYIDLWPIQIGTATAVSRSSDHSTYLTNFDSYVMVLQLGTVLHLVPYWNRNYKLRVMCFVENEADVEEETRRVAKLLRDLRVEAELCVHFLRNAGIESYDSAVLESPMVARDASASSVPPNARMAQSERPVQGVTFASPVQPPQEHVAESPQLGFSMRVNLPMPMRYESGRLGADSSSSESDSDFLSDCEPATGLRTPLQTDDDDGPARALARYATISEGDRRSPASVSRRQQLLSRATRRIRGGWPADRQPGVDAPPVNIPTADHNVQLQARRRSDGSAVLTDFYTRALAALNSNPQQQPPVAPVSTSPALPPHPAQQQQTEFNDMPTLTQNRILNELIRRESEPSTALIFTTLQAPELGASQNAQKTMDYLTEIDTLAHDLPPVFLVHATSLTVTTSL